MIIKEQIEETLNFKIDIYGISYKDLCQESIDRDVGDLDEFLINMLGAFDSYDFELHEEHKSDRTDSTSLYYTFIKTENEHKVLKAFVEVRLSDHEAPDRTIHGEYVTSTQMAKRYLNKRVKELSKTFTLANGYKKRFVNLVMNGIHYNDYNDALDKIEDILQHVGK